MTYQTRNRVLLSLSAETRQAVIERCEKVDLEVGTILHRVGDKTYATFFPETAVISTLASYADGSMIEMANVGSEACTGFNVILGGSIQLTTNEAQVSGTALKLPINQFHHLKSRYSDFESALFSAAQSLFFQVMVSGACNGAHDAKQRLARWLLTMKDRADGEEINLTHEFLAQMLGVRRATVTKVASELQAAGFIQYSRGRVKITDHAGLHAASCECYDLVRSTNHELLPDKSA